MKVTELDLDRAQSLRGVADVNTKRHGRTTREAFREWPENATGIAGPVVIQTKRWPSLGTIACAVVMFVALAGVGVILAWRG